MVGPNGEPPLVRRAAAWFVARMRRLLLSGVLVVSFLACEKPAEKPQPAPALPAEAPSSVKKESHGSGLPFEPGQMPEIEDLKVEDLAKFLVANAWCTNQPAEARMVFSKDGTYALHQSGMPAPIDKGQWVVLNGRVQLSPAANGAPRMVDVQAGKVNGRTVVSLDGKLAAACE